MRITKQACTYASFSCLYLSNVNLKKLYYKILTGVILTGGNSIVHHKFDPNEKAKGSSKACKIWIRQINSCHKFSLKCVYNAVRDFVKVDSTQIPPVILNSFRSRLWQWVRNLISMLSME